MSIGTRSRRGKAVASSVIFIIRDSRSRMMVSPVRNTACKPAKKAPRINQIAFRKPVWKQFAILFNGTEIAYIDSPLIMKYASVTQCAQTRKGG